MWIILGIEPTKDIKEIKKAYSKLLRQYHPEDNPKEYQRVRQAYDEAIKYAKNENSKDDEIEAKIIKLHTEELEKENKTNRFPFNLKDDYVNPSIEEEKVLITTSLLISKQNKIAKLYADIKARLVLDNWIEILDDEKLTNDLDTFGSLSRFVIRFILDNNVLPVTILNYLNQVFDWDEDYASFAKYVDEKKLDDLLIRLKEEDEFVDYSFDADVYGLDVNKYLDLRVRGYKALSKDDRVGAYNLLGEAYSMCQKDPVLLELLCKYFHRVKESGKGLNIAEKLLGFDGYKVGALRFKAQFAYMLKEYDLAIESCIESLEIKEDREMYHILAESYFLTNNIQEAFFISRRGLKAFVDDIKLHITNVKIDQYLSDRNILNKTLREIRHEERRRSKIGQVFLKGD